MILVFFCFNSFIARQTTVSISKPFAVGQSKRISVSPVSIHHSSNSILHQLYRYRYHAMATAAILALAIIKSYYWKISSVADGEAKKEIDLNVFSSYLLAHVPTADVLYPIPEEPDPINSGIKNKRWNLPSKADETIFFYAQGKPYYEFTNFWPSPIKAMEYNDDGHQDGEVVWPTTEHYFQAQKFQHRRVSRDEYRQMTSARLAQDFAQQGQAKGYVDPNWNKEDVFLPAMYRALTYKFTQHPDLYKKLMETKGKILVEDTAQSTGWDDTRWGAGKEYKGQNYLGRLLMYIRDKSETFVAAQQNANVAQ